MRIQEIVTESVYTDDLRDDVTNLLVAVSAEGITKIDMDQLQVDLHNLGYNVDTKSLFTLVKELPIVKNANYNTIELANDDVDTVLDEPVDKVDPTAVDKLAAKQVAKDIK